MMRCMVDYSAKMEKTLKALSELLHPTRSQPEPASTSTPVPGPDSMPIPTPSPSFITPLVSQPDPLLQEAIPEINTKDIASLRTWAEGGPENFTTPIKRAPLFWAPSRHPERSARKRRGDQRSKRRGKSKSPSANPGAQRKKERMIQSPSVPTTRSIRSQQPPPNPI